MSKRRELEILVQLLKEIRVDTGLRQVDLAKNLGVPQSRVSKYELGERRVDIIELRNICKCLGTDLVDFVAELEKRLEKSDATD